MKPVQRVPLKHVFVCVNEKGDVSKDCCAKVGGLNIYDKLKQFVAQKGLTGHIWITKSKCLGFCNAVGTTIVIYPEQEFFTEVTEKDLEEIYGKLIQ